MISSLPKLTKTKSKIGALNTKFERLKNAGCMIPRVKEPKAKTIMLM